MLDWITTMPGLLIAGGVILLLIALILFILGSKKEKTSNNIAMNTGIANQQLVNDTVNTIEPTPVANEPKFASLEPPTESLDVTTEYDFSVSGEIPVAEPEVTIYGGNNPLENTQIVSEIVPEQYGGNESQTTEPEIQAIPINEIPTIEIPTMEELPEDNKEEL